VHRIAARMDGMYQLVAGAFSSNPEKSLQSGLSLGLAANRVYATYKELLQKEKALPEQERIQVVSIVTPNHLHFEPAKMALELGYHVVLDKPMTFNVAEAIALAETVATTKNKLCLTHTYTGYPMVKEAKHLIASGLLGNIRKIYVEYPQGWLSTFLEASEQKQASWRTNPQTSGAAGAMGDIGTHAFNLAEYVSGLQTTHLCAELYTKVQGRLLDDDGAVFLKYNNGATGVLIASQIAAGEENNIKLRVIGEKGSIMWQQKDNNSLAIQWLDKPTEIYRTGTGYVSAVAQHNTRVPAGHPEGYLEAFANLYRNFALHIIKGDEATEIEKDYPTVAMGIRGMQFIEQVVASSKEAKTWRAI
jgi:predicted dehydrogenase